MITPFGPPSPNTVRLVHIRRPRDLPEPCDACKQPCGASTYWRVRAHIIVNDDEHRHTVEHACSEACARMLYDNARVEIALITDQPPAVTKYQTHEDT